MDEPQRSDPTPSAASQKRVKLTKLTKSITISYFEEPFELVNDGKTQKMYRCNVCKHKINGTMRSNFYKHMKTKHADIYYTKINKKDTMAMKRLRILFATILN